MLIKSVDTRIMRDYDWRISHTTEGDMEVTQLYHLHPARLTAEQAAVAEAILARNPIRSGDMALLAMFLGLTRPTTPPDTREAA
jgi:hypothetical protein